MRKALFFALKSKSAGHFALFQTAGKPALPAIHKFQSQTKTLRLELKNEKLAENRNYKRVKDKDGNVVANIITVFGQDVEVSDEIFDTYSQMDRRARYIGEDIPAENEISLERTMEDGIHIETLENAEPSAEEICIEHENAKMREEQAKHLPIVLAKLSDDEKRLIDALYFRGLGVREYAREISVPPMKIVRDRNRILDKLKNIFQISKFS